MPGSGTSVVDLHTHTLRSDGILTPVELVRAAAEAGITTLAITDHDTLAAHRDLILGRAIAADPAPATFVDGVEGMAVLDAIRRSAAEGRWVDVEAASAAVVGRG